MSENFITRILVSTGLVRKAAPLQMKSLQEAQAEPRNPPPALPVSRKPTPAPGSVVAPVEGPQKVALPFGDSEVVHTMIPESATIVGNVEISDSVVFQGIVRGDVMVHGDNQVVLGQRASMHGSIHSKAAIIAGNIEGDIEAERLVLTETAIVHGDITYGTLSMAEGAAVYGRLKRKIPNVVNDDVPGAEIPINLGPNARIEAAVPRADAGIAPAQAQSLRVA